MLVSALEPRQEGVFGLMNYVIKRDAIRAFGLYFSEILKFDCKPVLFPSDPQMNIPKMIACSVVICRSLGKNRLTIEF